MISISPGTCFTVTVAPVAIAILAPLTSAAAAAQDDFSWIRGANYVPSCAATDVEIWLDYDRHLPSLGSVN